MIEKELKIKELEWRDNVTELGRTFGLSEIISTMKPIDLWYSISNRNVLGESEAGKIFLREDSTNLKIECKSIEEAKLKAQKHFEKRVMTLFFEKN